MIANRLRPRAPERRGLFFGGGVWANVGRLLRPGANVGPANASRGRRGPGRSSPGPRRPPPRYAAPVPSDGLLEKIPFSTSISLERAAPTGLTGVNGLTTERGAIMNAHLVVRFTNDVRVMESLFE
jgi:hypothetical protein